MLFTYHWIRTLKMSVDSSPSSPKIINCLGRTKKFRKCLQSTLFKFAVCAARLTPFPQTLRVTGMLAFISPGRINLLSVAYVNLHKATAYSHGDTFFDIILQYHSTQSTAVFHTNTKVIETQYWRYYPKNRKKISNSMTNASSGFHVDTISISILTEPQPVSGARWTPI